MNDQVKGAVRTALTREIVPAWLAPWLVKLILLIGVGWASWLTKDNLDLRNMITVLSVKMDTVIEVTKENKEELKDMRRDIRRVNRNRGD
jgi:hypothetical protein